VSLSDFGREKAPKAMIVGIEGVICNELCDYYNLPTPRALYVYQNSEVGILLDRLKRDIAKKLEKALELFKQ